MLPRFYQNFLRLNRIEKQLILRCYATGNATLKYNVPPLHQSLDTYTKYLRPLVSDSEYRHTLDLINDFRKPNGEGEILQALLQRKSENTENWLSEWWTNVAYLDGRDPIVINSNPGVRFPIEKFRNTDEWLNFSVNIVTSFLKYKLLIDSGKLPQDYLKSEPLCMNQYYTLFNTCRIPGQRRDEIYSGKSHLMKMENRIGYITVAHKNRFFIMDVIDQTTQKIYSKEAIFRGLSQILDISQNKGQPIGLMTAENRNTWGTSYMRLLSNPVNSEAFSYINQSIFLFCLDDPVFVSEYDKENPDSLVARNMLHGNGYNMNSANRWFDKTIQLIVSSDGACGMNYEHTPAEAPPLISMIDYAYKDMKTESDDVISQKPGACRIQEIKFNFDKKSHEEMDASVNNINSLVNDLELHALSFNDFGKSKIKEYKISPDAFIQMGIQLGYYNLHKCAGSTYESGSLRRFKLGRTDTIRSCSPELIEFCKSVNDINSTKSENKRLLLSSIDIHSKYTKAVLNGQGIDRHLLGLKLIAIENRRNIPDIFMDTSYSKAFHHVLSTSQGPSVVDLTMCFGPLVPDGYGFCYNPMPNKINLCVSAINSSPTTQALALSHHIKEAWNKMINILQN